MKSNLSELEFKKSLHKNMIHGKPIWRFIVLWPMLNLIRPSNKAFIGDYNDSSFILTKRTILFPVPYLIEGSYKGLNDFETEVFISIKPLMRFNLLFGRVMAILFVLIFSFVMLSINGLIGGLLTLVISLFLLVIIPIRIIKLRKNQMEEEFKTIFNIINK